MRLPRILNQCHPIPGFVYERASFAEDAQTILIPVRPRKRSTAICSGCHQPAPGYDQSRTPRRFEFIGFWGYLILGSSGESVGNLQVSALGLSEEAVELAAGGVE